MKAKTEREHQNHEKLSDVRENSWKLLEVNRKPPKFCDQYQKTRHLDSTTQKSTINNKSMQIYIRNQSEKNTTNRQEKRE
jgi:hypothetical protein